MDTVVLDKTGTVTTGVMAVTGVEAAAGESRDALLRYAGAVEQASEHPVAGAVSAAARAELGSLPQAERFLAMPGLGARGSVDDHDVIIGREDLFAHLGMTIPADLARRIHEYEQAGCTSRAGRVGRAGPRSGRGRRHGQAVRRCRCRRAAEAGPAHRAADR